MSEALDIGPRVCVVGAGAIGGWMAARLAAAGEQVSVLARGAVLERVRSRGIELHSGDQEQVVRVHAASDDARALGPQDVVIVAVKAQALPALAPLLAPLMHPGTVLLPAINGLPWWTFLPEGVAQSGLRLRSVDPDGDIERTIPLPHVLGISVFASSSSPAPGVVRHNSGQRLVLGEPAGGMSARVRQIAERFSAAGFAAEASADIRLDIWNKLLGNACFNTVSLLTLRHTDEMIDDPHLNRLFVRMMSEALVVGESIGLKVASSPGERISVTRRLGHIKTSTLQDLEAGRPVEIEAILGALVECAGASGVPVPVLDSVLALARARAGAGSLL